MDVQTARIHELGTDVLEEWKKVETLHKQFQEAKSRLAKVVHEIRDRSEEMIAECVTLVEQVEDGKIFDGEMRRKPLVLKMKMILLK
mgnify:CR=1 FL=1